MCIKMNKKVFFKSKWGIGYIFLINIIFISSFYYANKYNPLTTKPFQKYTYIVVSEKIKDNAPNNEMLYLVRDQITNKVYSIDYKLFYSIENGEMLSMPLITAESQYEAFYMLFIILFSVGIIITTFVYFFWLDVIIGVF